MPTTRKSFIQQSAFALAGTCLPFSKLFAKDSILEKGLSSKQSITDCTGGNSYHPKNCSISLVNSYQYTYRTNADGSVASNSDIDVLDGYYSYPDGALNTTNPDFNDVQYHEETVETGTCFPTGTIYPTKCDNVDSEGKNPFRYKAYYPKPCPVHNYGSATTSGVPLPVYILFHAGGFAECSTYEGDQLNQTCIELAQKGFIAFSVEYRKRRVLDSAYTDTNRLTSVQQQMARYRPFKTDAAPSALL